MGTHRIPRGLEGHWGSGLALRGLFNRLHNRIVEAHGIRDDGGEQEPRPLTQAERDILTHRPGRPAGWPRRMRRGATITLTSDGWTVMAALIHGQSFAGEYPRRRDAMKRKVDPHWAKLFGVSAEPREIERWRCGCDQCEYRVDFWARDEAEEAAEALQKAGHVHRRPRLATMLLGVVRAS